MTDIDVARLPLDLPLRCRCGRVRGVASDVSPSGGFRFVCYCKDCQAFARFLERPDVLDPAGGTDIFQMPPARVRLSAGMDAVRCLRLSDKGVLRWYTDCCRTLSATPQRSRASRSWPWFTVSWSTGPRVHPATRCSARRSAASTNALPSGRSRRTRPRRPRSESSPAAQRRSSAGGCAGSLGRLPSSTIARTLRAPCRACSRAVTAQPFEGARLEGMISDRHVGSIRAWRR